MAIRTAKFTIRIAIIIFLLLVISFTSFIIWIKTGEREIPLLDILISSALSKQYPDYNIAIEGNSITMQTVRGGIDIIIKNVDIAKPQHEPDITIANIKANLSIVNLIRGKLTPRYIEVNNTAINLDLGSADESGSINMYEATRDFLEDLHESQLTNSKIDRIVINDTHIIIPSSLHDRFNIRTITLQTASANVENGKTPTLIVNSKVRVQNLQNDNMELDPIIKVTLQDDDLNVKLSLNDIESQGLGKLYIGDKPAIVDDLEKSNVKFSSAISFKIEESGTIKNFNADIQKFTGKLSFPYLFKKPLNVTDASFTCDMATNFLTLDCYDMDLLTGKTTISGSTGFSLDSTKLTIHSNLIAKNIDIQQLNELWPIPIGTNIRDWVVSNVIDGKVSSATADFILSKSIGADSKMLPEKLESKIIFTDATYSDPYLGVKFINSNGEVKFTPKTMQVKIDSAKYNNYGHKAEISDTIIAIDDFAKNRIKISGKSQGDLQHILDFYRDGTKYQKEIIVKDTNLRTATAQTDNKFYVELPLSGEIKEEDVRFAVESNISKFNVPASYNDIKISEGNFKFLLNNDNIEIKGTGYAGNAPIYFEINKNISDADLPSYYLLKSSTNIANLKKLGFPDVDFIKGRATVSAVIKEQSDKNRLFFMADLNSSYISVPQVFWLKPQYKNAIFELQADIDKKDHKNITINHLLLKSDDMEAKGVATLTPDLKGVRNVNMSVKKGGVVDIKVDFTNNAGNYDIKVSGEYLDLSGMEFGNLMGDSNNEGNLSINADVKRIFLKNNTEFSQVKANLKCNKSSCITGSIYALIGENNLFDLSYQPIGEDKYRLQANSDNASVVMKAFNIYTRTNGGTLSLDAINERVDGKYMLHGEAIIRNFKVVKASVLAKLLSLASLDGVLGLLDGEGIPFKDFSLPFSLQDSVIKVRDAKGKGSSIGITLEGEVNLKQSLLALSGSVIPAYHLNQIINKVPVVGGLLTGGGKGIFAANYKIKGGFDDPKISVNPLSIIAPGFLRKIFD